jgi:hypothetical protein
MRHMIRISIVAIFGLLLTVVQASAHHSFTAEYDVSQPVNLKGSITELDWVNPHVYMTLDVKDDSGKTTEWRVSSFGTGACHRAGLTKARLAPGTAVEIRAYRAKDGTKNLAYLRNIKFADGSEVEMWLGGGSDPPPQDGAR